ncbi:MAG: dTDP-4-dehydrorhamnose 3,5-epimerase family protein [Candidatus Pacebacteria bacterium]|nr:dTDP-4-dehydrorhamnose 3,5-epimerase family protein [Candidatus Paceibacterota bacterium]
MKIEPTHIRDVFVVTPEAHEDQRGFVVETYRKDLFEQAGITEPMHQIHHVYSHEPHTMRGLNFQWQPPMGKLVSVARGRAFLVAVDLRKGSPTLGQWFGIEASESNHAALYAPSGFARGALTLEPGTLVKYVSSGVHDGKPAESAITWDDPDINIAWPLTEQPKYPKQAQTLKEWLAHPDSDNFQY